MCPLNNPQAGPTGILILDKPVGPSSMAAISVVRRRASRSAGRKIKTGHAGTLDPLASGVLVLALGRATKSLDRFMQTDKRYRTTIDLSAFTTTDDREGERSEVDVAQPPTAERIDAVLPQFIGDIEQVPPAFSAIKVDGKRAYKTARKGGEVTLAPRTVRIYDIKLLSYDWPMLEIDLHCEKGVYVRSLARDIGRALGTGGHCAALRRTAVGPFDESIAIALDDVPDPLRQEHVLTTDEALAKLGRPGDA